jgi:hypothetical protein
LDSIQLSSAELYDVGLGFSSLWHPEIATATLTFTSGNRLFLAGSRFQGVHLASFRRQNPGLIEQLSDRAIAQPR